MSNYRLTLAAEIDLANILEYGKAHFGTSAALEFYEGLLSVFPKIVDNPAQFSRIDKVARYSNQQFPCQSHFYNLLMRGKMI